MFHICIHHDVGVNGAFHSASETLPHPTPISWNLRLESRRNLEDPECTIRYGCSLYQHCVLHHFSVTWPVFSVVKKCNNGVVQHRPVHVLFLCLQTVTYCAVIHRYGLTMLTTATEVSISLFQLTNGTLAQPVCDVTPSSEFRLPR